MFPLTPLADRFLGIGLAACAVICCCATPSWAVTVLDNETIAGLYEVTDGEWVELHNTITLDNATIDVVDGLLLSTTPMVNVVGAGDIYLRSFDGNWSSAASANSLLIGSDVTVVGETGSILYMSGALTLEGSIVATPGAITTAGPFSVKVADFVNSGLLEAQDGAFLSLIVRGDPLVNNGIFRAQSGGILSLRRDTLHTHVYSMSELGAIENNGGTVQLGLAIDNVGRTLEFAGGEWQLSRNAEIHGGELTTGVGGSLTVGAGSITLRGVTLNTDITSLFTSRTKLADDVTLNGVWNLGWQIKFEGDETLNGTGTIVTDGEHGWLLAPARTVIEAGITLESRSGGRLRLLNEGFGSTGSFELHGLTNADGGIVEIGRFVTVDNHAQMVARNGGRLQLVNTSSGANSLITLNNHPGAEIRAEPGSEIFFGAQINNEGALTIEQANVVVYDYDVTGSGTVSITDSLILAAATTLTELLSVPGTGNEYSTYYSDLDLEGANLELADQPGKRWTLRGGELTGGRVTSLDGQELVTAPSLGGTESDTSLSDLQLDADLRVVAGTSARILNGVTGAGNYIVDGGRLFVGSLFGSNDVASQLSHVVPLGGDVILTGTIDNVGETFSLPSGVTWHVQHSRSDFLVGGRIEGEPGVELHISRGYGSAGFATFRQGVTVALPIVVEDTELYVREGLTLDNATITIGLPNGDVFADARLSFIGVQTLAGTGEVHFNRIDGFPSHPTAPRINMIEVLSDGSSPAMLTIDENITVRTTEGSGYLGGRYFYQLPPEGANVTNYGRLVAENGHTLTIFTDQFSQLGVLRTEAQSTLIVNDPDITNDGRLEIVDGKMLFSGDVIQSPSSALSIELSEFARDADTAAIEVLGGVTLDGGLEAHLADGGPTPFVPVPGDTFLLLSAVGNITGDFVSWSLPTLDAGLYWNVHIGGQVIELQVLDGAPPGDFDSDGDVDGADFLAWQRDPTLGDLSSWKTHYGDMSLATSSIAVPEPSSLSLLVITIIASISSRRRSWIGFN